MKLTLHHRRRRSRPRNRPLRALRIACRFLAAAVVNFVVLFLFVFAIVRRAMAWFRRPKSIEQACLQIDVSQDAIPRSEATTSDARELAVKVLLACGERKRDAARWVAAASAIVPRSTDPAELVRGAFHAKVQQMYSSNDTECTSR